MSQEHISGFENSLKKTYEWIDDMQTELSWEADRQDAYHALRAGMHFVRDRLMPEEAAHLSAQLPMLVRGLYYEGWNPTDKPLEIDNYDEITTYLDSVIDTDLPADPTLVLRAMFKVLHKHISMGQLEHIQSMLPATMRVFWPNIVSDQ